MPGLNTRLPLVSQTIRAFFELWTSRVAACETRGEP